MFDKRRPAVDCGIISSMVHLCSNRIIRSIHLELTEFESSRVHKFQMQPHGHRGVEEEEARRRPTAFLPRRRSPSQQPQPRSISRPLIAIHLMKMKTTASTKKAVKSYQILGLSTHWIVHEWNEIIDLQHYDLQCTNIQKVK
mmetsp:Transcript_37178/g.90173  ORF Transcript_37178/g.90173 Transcript_37178/m.90173 type:complete len:142 (-) Transcript_37178:108-533(-)